jgi:hypothetical protein
MEQMLSLAGQNLLSPVILFFVLGVAAALARSDLSFPEAVAKGMSLYLLFAIGFKGGAGVPAHGADGRPGAGDPGRGGAVLPAAVRGLRAAAGCWRAGSR